MWPSATSSQTCHASQQFQHEVQQEIYQLPINGGPVVGAIYKGSYDSGSIHQLPLIFGNSHMAYAGPCRIRKLEQTTSRINACLSHGEAHALLDGGAGNELAGAGDVVARHGHLHLVAVGAHHALDLARDVAGAEVEDGHVAGHHRVGAAALVLLGEVDVCLELGVGLGGARGADHLAAEDGILVDTAAQHAHRVAGRALGEVGVEHSDSGDHGLLGLLATAQNLDLIALLHDALLNAASAHGTSARDGEHVLDGQQERLVSLALGRWDVLVNRLHELQDLVHPLVVTSVLRATLHEHLKI